MRYEVHLYWDGPYFSEDTVHLVEAGSEAGAVREAIAQVGTPKLGSVREVSG
jgi:hypothetical protein